MDSIYSILVRRKVAQDDIDKQIKQWLKLLLQLLVITGPDADKHLKLFLKGREAALKFYKSACEDAVSVV